MSRSSFAFGGFVVGSVVTVIISTLLKKDNESLETNRSNEYLLKKSVMQQLPKEIRSEQLSRNALYFGEKGMRNIESASVLVVGVGGVGSHTAHMLARAGIGYLRLVDFDQVTLSSLNRHACATLEDVGVPKVYAIKKFLEKICPDKTMLRIDARVQMYTGDPEKDIDLMECPNSTKSWDVIIDAIDDVPTKANLLAYCVKNKIRAISCMGAGGKSDVTRLHISDIRAASRDPLATKLRQTLKKMLKPESSFLEDIDQIAVIYSSEKTVVKLADFTDEQKADGVHKYGAVDNMRIRILPVLGTMPAVMGQSLAAMTLCELGDKPFNPMSAERLGRNVRHRLFQHFKNREMKIREDIEKQNDIIKEYFVEDDTCSGDSEDLLRPPATINGSWVGPAQIDVDDVEYMLTEVWRNRCCVTAERSSIEIVRWDISKPSNCQNLVVLAVKALKLFDKAASSTGDGRNSVPANIRRRIEARLAQCRPDSKA